MGDKSIVLVGMMGCGKSSVGKLLKQQLPYLDLVDIDAHIEKLENISINDIFETRGESFFREVEHKVIKKCSERDMQIIVTGGGALEDLDNLHALQKNGLLFYLYADVNELYFRIKDDKSRPKLNNTDYKKTLEFLLQKREANYQKADYIIDTNNKALADVVLEIVEIYTNLEQ